MKYGEHLSAYSVPEWQSHNILYDSLKHEIKELTISPSEFSDAKYRHLVAWLEEEISNVNLFVKCKIGEIEYRTQQCGQLVRELAEKRTLNGDTQVWQLRKEITQLTHEFQNILRFISAQYIGFKKLVKKYIKHAPPAEIAQGRDLQLVKSLLLAKDSFANVDLTLQLWDLSHLYSALRSGNFDAYLNPPFQDMSNVSVANRFAKHDTEMLSSSNANKWLFWVHRDNVMQLRVLLLQYMDLLAPDNPHKKSSSHTAGSLNTNSHAGHRLETTRVIYLDSKDLPSATTLKESAQIRQVKIHNSRSSPFMVVFAKDSRDTAVTKLNDIQYECLSSCRTVQNSANVLSGANNVVSVDSDKRYNNPEGHTSSDAAKNRPADPSENSDPTFESVVAQDVEPIVAIESVRSRFHNTEDRVWAAIDVDICTDESTGCSRKFPYAVLEIRAHSGVRWVDSLKNSSLVYHVHPSFSLYAWSILVTRAQQVLVRPSWIDLLESGMEIRREPESLGVVKPKRPSHSSDNDILVHHQPQSVRYWNEFDDGEDYEDDSTKFFDGDDLEMRRSRVAAKLAQPVYKIGEEMRRQFNTWFEGGSSHSSASVLSLSIHSEDIQSVNSIEPQSLRQFSPRVLSRRSSADGRSSGIRSHGGGLGDHGDPQLENLLMKRRNDQGLTLITFLCFCLSAGIVALVFAIIITEDLSILPSSVRAALVLFLIFALCLALLGYVAFHFRSQVSWTYQILVNINLFTIVCFGMGGIANISLPPLSQP